MCMEDVRLGRALGPGVQFGTFGNSKFASFVGPDPMRTRLIISGDGINPVTIIPEGGDPAHNNGLMITAQQPILVMRIEEYGRLLTGPWFANDGGLNVPLTVITATLEKQ